jgi:phosphoribosylformylglycinamidine cyclo-ligase
MDYIAGHRLPVEMIAGVVEGIARGCQAHAMALAGGETAQMPGLYAESTFDLAGTIIGVVDESQALHGEQIVPGDVLIGYQSSGLHTNGYTLARAVLFDSMGLELDAHLPGTAETVGHALLAVHRSYESAIRPALADIHGLAHITGGGIAGNLVRVLPEQCAAFIETESWQWPAIFSVIAAGGKVSISEMRDVFNLGLGMIAAVPPARVDHVRATAERAGVMTSVIGEVRSGARSVTFSA